VTLQQITAIKESALDQSLRKTLIKNAHIIGIAYKKNWGGEEVRKMAQVSCFFGPRRSFLFVVIVLKNLFPFSLRHTLN
jgi:hypothetical protein